MWGDSHAARVDADVRGVDREMRAVVEVIEENLPSEMEQEEWNWQAMATWANTRLGTNYRDLDLQKLDGCYAPWRFASRTQLRTSSMFTTVPSLIT